MSCKGSKCVFLSVYRSGGSSDHCHQRFKDRLLERNVIQNSAGFLSVDLLTCPLCLGPLVSCVDCDAEVACSNSTCPGSLAIDCEFCYEHNRMSCHACLAINHTVPSLIRCPVCQTWCCREDSDWCVGLVKEPALGTEEFAELSRECKWDSETIVRSHPPKPGPCTFCVDHDCALDWAACRNRGDDTQPEPDSCPSQTPFLTRHRLRAAHCPECVGQSPGYRCACGLGWLCETCFAIRNQSRDYPYLITCPRCGVDYCADPASRCGDYIEICRGCKGAILCNNCHEEEVLPGDIQTTKTRPKQIVFDSQCSYCEAWTCGDCRVSTRSAICFFCDEWFCFGCVSDRVHAVIQRCPCCALYVCVDCTMDHEGCPGTVAVCLLVCHL